MSKRKAPKKAGAKQVRRKSKRSQLLGTEVDLLLVNPRRGKARSIGGLSFRGQFVDWDTSTGTWGHGSSACCTSSKGGNMPSKKEKVVPRDAFSFAVALRTRVAAA